MNKAQKPFHVMAKPAGGLCNLSCGYCYYSGVKVRGRAIMDRDTLEIFTRAYIEENPSWRINFGWQGGEPLIAGLDFFKEAVSLQKKYGSLCEIENSLQTNATLLDDEYCEFFAKENFLIGISLDGPKTLHGAFRGDSFEKVMRGISLCKKHGVRFNILTTVNSGNVNYPKEVWKFILSTGTERVQFIPIVERGSGPDDFICAPIPKKSECEQRVDLSRVSPDPEAYGEFLCSIFRLWVKNSIGRVFVGDFDDMILAHRNMPVSTCVHARECGRALLMESDGSVYICDHYVRDDCLLGNIHDKSFSDMLSDDKAVFFGQSKHDALSGICKKCFALKYCAGDCLKRRLDFYEKEDYPTSAMCKGLRKFYAFARPQIEKIAFLVDAGTPMDVISEIVNSRRK